MEKAPEKVIEVKNVRKIYRMGTEKIYAVDDVSFDIYEGEQVGEGKKSVAFALTFRAKDRTLADTEINEIMEKILAELTKLGANLRQ